MQFTGFNQLLIPQSSGFNFVITGLSFTDNKPVNFIFSDTNNNSFNFVFSGGYIFSSGIIGTYNLYNANQIVGYYNSGKLNYQINGIYNQTPITFGNLNTITLSGGSGVVYCDFIINSNPISYSIDFLPNYNFSSILTGMITSNIAFTVFDSNMLFYNSNKNLLQNNYISGFNVNTGINYLYFQDIDSDFMEYQNNFFISFQTTFGEIDGQFSSYRGGIINQSLLSLNSYSTNNYSASAEFTGNITGFQSGSLFTYTDTPVQYSVGYSFGNSDFIGDDLSGILNINFQPLYPLNNTTYNSSYITGVLVKSGGYYEYPPSLYFSQYYAITGIQNSLQSLLFSTGCSNQILVTYSGDSPIISASGYLVLNTVSVSGIYNNGLTQYKVVNAYSGINIGSGYTGIPIFILATGGGCFSIPDASGYQTAQFMFASGFGAVKNQAAGLMGTLNYTQSGSGYYVNAIKLTNIGFGYNTGSFYPHIYFIRQSGDNFTSSGNASGQCYFINPETYNFTGLWNVLVNFGTGYVPIPSYNGYYSGNYPTFGQQTTNVQINLSGFDNMTPISGLLSLNMSNSVNNLNIQNTISQSRTFNI